MPKIRSQNSANDWSDPSRYVKKILVERSVADLPYTGEILTRAGSIPHTVVADGWRPDTGDSSYGSQLREGKKHLLLSRNRGAFFKPCPATREYRCCDYHVLNIGMNCPMDCVYCILQAYLNNPWLSFFVNIGDLFQELDALEGGATFYRIGTGEFTDSMALDRLTGLSRILVDYMRDKRSMVLELKTKAANIDHLLALDHGGKTITAWSLNATAIMAHEELRTATLDQRLEAAKRCVDAGYPVAFHFDPIVDHPGWREGYAETIDRLFRAIPAHRIVWISMGGLRFLPQLKPIATARFGGSRIFYQEFIPGLDGKSRYFRSRRVQLYGHLYKLLRQRAAAATAIYLCMESDAIWQEVFGYIPADRGGLPQILEQAARRFCH